MLPGEFEKRMKWLLGAEYEAFLAGFEREPMAGLRLNQLKITPEEWDKLVQLGKCPYRLRPIPWVKNGYYYNPKEYGQGKMASPTRHPFYYAGLYYIQEPSAMTPASLLSVQPGEKVLDLCAAPGGKSTELAARLAGKGILVSNDISSTRAKALLKNLAVFGVRNALVLTESPRNLTKVFSEYFDKILIDAPCSGEGMFRKEPAIMKNWQQYGVEYYHKIQKEIILYAAQMLRPGGLLLYSTCTFSPEENEGTIAWLLSHYPEFVLKPVADRYEGFDVGHPEWIELPDNVKDRSEEFRHLVRIWPHRMEGEGHFCALLQKNENSEQTKCIQSRKMEKGAILEKAEIDFLEAVGFGMEELARVEIYGGKLFLVPEGLPELGNMRILRNGLYLGDRKKGRLEPSQPLAMALTGKRVPDFTNLAIEDPAVIKYLKCETIEVPASKNNTSRNDDMPFKRIFPEGMTLVGTEGYPLGWGKKTGTTTIKNKYFPGWRMM